MKKLSLILALLIAGTSLSYSQLRVVTNGSVGIGTTTPTLKLDVNGGFNVRGSLFNLGENIGGNDARVEIGRNRTANGNAYFDLIGDIAFPDFGVRLIRLSSGVSRFDHRGTQNFEIRALENASILFKTTNVERARVTTAGLMPGADNAFDLGSASRRWDDIYATNGVIQTSDARTKTDIKDMEYGLAEILEMRPVSFKWIGKEKGGDKLGLIAQEVQEIVPEVVKASDFVIDDVDYTKSTIQENALLGLNYSDLIPVLINAMQEQNEIIEEKDAQIEDLAQRLERLESMLLKEDAKTEGTTTNVLLEGTGRLEQNTPNPFSENTVIKYELTDKDVKAEIQIFSLTGELLKVVPADGNTGQVNVQVTDMPAGTYTYSLVVNGAVIDSKKMVLSK